MLNPQVREPHRFLVASIPSFDAITLAELLMGGLLSVKASGWDEIAGLALAEESASLAEGGQVRAGSAADPKLDRYADRYVEYARQCALARNGDLVIDRTLFDKAVTVLVNSDDWRVAGAKITTEFRIPHPSIDPDSPYDSRRFTDSARVLAHFDFFRFGQRNPHGCAWRILYRAADTAMREHERAVIELVRSFVPKDMDWGEVLREVGGKMPGGWSEKDAQHRRALEVFEWLDRKWWEDFDAGDPRWWQPGGASPYLGWFATALDKGGGATAQILNNRIERFAEESMGELKHAVKDFRKVATKLVALHKKLGLDHKLVELSDGKSLVVDFLEHKVTIDSPSGKELGRFEFFERPKVVQPGVRTTKYQRLKEIRKTTVATKRPIPTLHDAKVPVFIGALGSVLGAAIAIKDLSKELKEKDNVLVFGRVGQSLFQACDAVVDVVKLIGGTAWAKDIGFLGKVFKPVGLGLEAAFNLHESALIYIDLARNPDAATGELVVKGSKATVLLVSGVGAGASIAGLPLAVAEGEVVAASLLGAGLGAATVILAVGGISYTIVDVVSVLVLGAPDAAKDLDEKIGKGKQAELDTGYRVARTADAMETYRRELGEVLASPSH